MPFSKNLDTDYHCHQCVNDTNISSRRRQFLFRIVLLFLLILTLNLPILPTVLCARRRWESNGMFQRDVRLLGQVPIPSGDLQYRTRDGKLLGLRKFIPLRNLEQGYRDERKRRRPRPARPREGRREREYRRRLSRILTRLLDRVGRRGEERKKTVYNRRRYDGRYKDPRKRTKRRRKKYGGKDESRRRRRILTNLKNYDGKDESRRRRRTLTKLENYWRRTRTISREADDGPRIRTLRGRLAPLKAPDDSRYVYTVIASPYGQMKIDKDDWIVGEGPLMKPRWTRKDQGEFEAIWKEDEEESEEGRMWMHLLVHRRKANNTKSKGRWKEFTVREMDDQEPLDRVFLFNFDAGTVEVLRSQRNILNSLKKRIDTRKILGAAWKKADEEEEDDDDSDESSSSSTDDDEEEEEGEEMKSKWRMRKRSKTPKRRKRAKSKEVKKEST